MLLFIERDYRIYKDQVIGGAVFTLYYLGMAVNSYDSFGAALDAIGRISGK